MSENNSTTSLLALTPFPIYAKPWSTVSIILTMLGLFGNGNIIIATIRGKALKNKCSYLIAINAAFDFLADVGFLQVNAYIQLNELKMPNDVCFRRISDQIFAMNVGAFLIWTIGLDRLFAIKFATRYYLWKPKLYLFLMVLPAVVYSAALTLVGFLSSSPDEKVLLCMPPTAFIGVASNVWILTGVIINILVIITYGWVLVLVRKQARIRDTNRQEGGHDPMRHVTDSLLLIVVIYILGWLITMTVLLVVTKVAMNPSIAFHSALYVGWNALISVGCNYYIYFTRSSDYAQLFREQLCCWRKKTMVTQIQSQTQRNKSRYADEKSVPRRPSVAVIYV